MYPYFHQSWSLFVPVPKENFNVYVKHDNKDWEDVFQTVISKHHTNRLAGNENLMLALSSSLRYYVSSVNSQNSILNDDDSNINFVVLKKIIKQYYTIKENAPPSNMQIIIVTKNIYGAGNYAHYYRAID